LLMFLLSSPGYLLKKSAKNNEWSRRWFVLNEKSGKVNKSLQWGLLLMLIIL
jgi:hypothetical protein